MTGRKRITDRKFLNVDLPTRMPWLTGMHEGFQIKSDELAGEYETDDWGRTWQKKVKRFLYIDGCTVEDASARMREKAEGLTDVTLDFDRSDDGWPEVYLIGYRDTTEAEVAEVLRFLEWDKEQRQERDQTVREHVIKQAKALGLKPEDLA